MRVVNYFESLIGLVSLLLCLMQSGAHRSFPFLIIPEVAQKAPAVTLDVAIPIRRVTEAGIKMIMTQFPGKMT